MELEGPVEELKGIGPASAALLKRNGISTLGDLLYYLPRRYEDYSHVRLIRDLSPGGEGTIKVQVESIAGRYVRRGMHVTEAIVRDESGETKLVWFNQPYRAGALKYNTWYYVSGSFDFHRNRYAMVNPSMEQVSSLQRSTARIVPVYREAKGLKSVQLRAWIQEALKITRRTPDPFPKRLMRGFISQHDALRRIHFPDKADDIEKAKDRLGFEEVVVLLLASELAKRQIATEIAPVVDHDDELLKKFVASLPFKLTDAQRAVAWQVVKDLASTTPMNRLIEGDVGSGKTVVAAMAALTVLRAGYQVAVMAPTEVLSRQHAATFSKLLQPFRIKPTLLTGSLPKPEKTKIRQRITKGEIGVAIGTHALIDENIEFHNLGLVIIDEQHRFGVNQRQKLMRMQAAFPHLLTMTATPIPRSLALILYGELAISIINQLPPGRKRVITKVASPLKRLDVYRHVEEQIKTGRQAFVVAPLIDPSDQLGARSAKAEYERLSSTVFKHRRIALLHGRLKAQDKAVIMEDFLNKKYEILVATSVIEVGVDVPNANVMLIEGAERFGLAQLHQLRGRVGRSHHQSYCYIIPTSEEAVSRRLRYLETVSDGFRLAELDLKLRGPGQIYGWRQHGQLDLRIANLSDARLIATARERALELLASRTKLVQYPWLLKRINAARTVTTLN